MRVREESNLERLLRKDKDIKGYILRDFTETLMKAVEDKANKEGKDKVLEIIS